MHGVIIPSFGFLAVCFLICWVGDIWGKVHEQNQKDKQA